MRFHTLQQWLEWQETLHPREIELGLGRVTTVLTRLHLRYPRFKVITVAGTNGKGSSVAMLDAILRAAGYRVGCYSSPHLLRYNERVRVDGREVDDDTLCAAFERIDRARGDVSLTYFEFGTLAAIDLFQRHGVEVAVLEVGMGGRLDAVNALDADAALITTIDIDHQAWLGDTREAIGREKAGILRAARPAVCADPQSPQSLLAHARQLGAPLAVLGRDFFLDELADGWRWRGPDGSALTLPRPALPGAHQLRNAAGVVMALQAVARVLPVTPDALRQGLLDVRLPGRFQVIPGPPRQIFDVAHNPQGAQILAQTLASEPCAGRTRLVLAMLADKDIAGVIAALRAVVHDWYLAPLDPPRGAALATLTAAMPALPYRGFDSVRAAFAAALREAQAADRVVVTGSFHTVAAALLRAV